MHNVAGLRPDRYNGREITETERHTPEEANWSPKRIGETPKPPMKIICESRSEFAMVLRNLGVKETCTTPVTSPHQHWLPISSSPKRKESPGTSEVASPPESRPAVCHSARDGGASLVKPVAADRLRLSLSLSRCDRAAQPSLAVGEKGRSAEKARCRERERERATFRSIKSIT